MTIELSKDEQDSIDNLESQANNQAENDGYASVRACIGYVPVRKVLAIVERLRNLPQKRDTLTLEESSAVGAVLATVENVRGFLATKEQAATVRKLLNEAYPHTEKPKVKTPGQVLYELDYHGAAWLKWDQISADQRAKQEARAKAVVDHVNAQEREKSQANVDVALQRIAMASNWNPHGFSLDYITNKAVR